MSQPLPNVKPDTGRLHAGVACDDCGCQLGLLPTDEPCPACGSVTRRLPRRPGQTAGETA